MDGPVVFVGFYWIFVFYHTFYSSIFVFTYRIQWKVNFYSYSYINAILSSHFEGILKQFKFNYCDLVFCKPIGLLCT